MIEFQSVSSGGGGSDLVTKLCQTFATPRAVACQAPLSTGFARHKYWSGLSFPSPKIFPIQESNPALWHCRQILYQLSYQGSPLNILSCFFLKNKYLISLQNKN